MGTWIKRVALALLIVVALAILVSLFLPTQYDVSRSVVIDAEPERIDQYVGDLRKWDEWAPWKEEDPSIVVTFGDKTSGVGASQSWAGKSGDGSLLFTMSSPEKGIKYDLFFDKGAYKCEGAMLYDPIADSETKVTWNMKGDMNTPVIGGYFAIMMDSMAGKMFKKGFLSSRRRLRERVFDVCSSLVV